VSSPARKRNHDGLVILRRSRDDSKLWPLVPWNCCVARVSGATSVPMSRLVGPAVEELLRFISPAQFVLHHGGRVA